MPVPRYLRKLSLLATVAAAFAMLAPAASAGGRHDGHRGYRGPSRVVVHHPVRPMYRQPAYRYRAAPRMSRGYYAGGYAPAVRYDAYGYYGPRRHRHHSHVGEALGALVVGAILADVITDATAPRTRVVERRVVSGPYYPDTPPTRYVRSESGYYEDR